jgi:hypothetical protein
VYSINLNKLDFARVKALGFSLRKANFKDNIILKVVLTNSAREQSVIYINEMPSYRWKDYKINLTEFKDISKWAEMSELSFIVETGLVQKDNGIVYIDNVRLLK